MNVTIDLNIFLDFFLRRGEHEAALELLSLCKEKAITGFTPSHGLPTVYYLLRKNLGNEKALHAIDYLLQFLEITPINKELLIKARKKEFSDYEDAIVFTSATQNNSEFIVTSNIKHFKQSEIPVVTAKFFMSEIVSKYGI